MTMKTFPSYDYSLCDNEACGKKETCMRYLTHLKAVAEKYPYPVAYLLPNKDEECEVYVKANNHEDDY